VSIVCKDNVLKHSDGWFHALCAEELAATPGLTYDHVYVDEAARRLVVCPEVFDVIVTSNLYGDILSDVAAEIMGGMPMAPSAGLGEACAYFESCHGSALDIAGRDLANPSATILSAAMMLAYLGCEDMARKLVDATLATIAAGCKTRDLGGTATTSGFTEAVCQRLRAG
jgi:isocitrate/isopropylmalate dehydrogenase